MDIVVALIVALLGLIGPPIDADSAPGDGLGLTTNRPRPISAPTTPPPSFPLPGAGLGGLAALAGVAAGARRPGKRRLRDAGDDGDIDDLDGDLESVWGLEPGDEVLFIDPAGDGRIAVRIGPADADFVAFLVPGTGVDLGDVSDYVARTRNIQQAAQHYAGYRTASVIFALPFDSPDRILAGPADPDCACNSTKALQGGAELTAFVEGLELDAQRVTVIGHSYGSTVVGEAFTHHGLGRVADTVIFLGSPGVLAHNADELNAPGGVYAAQASFDFIDMAGPWPVLNAVSVRDRPSKDMLIFGVDPTAPQFGAVRLPAGGFGHSSYFFDPISLRSLGMIIAGKDPLAPRPWPRRVRPPTAGRAE
jgi:Alpha/beta hydrolase